MRRSDAVIGALLALNIIAFFAFGLPGSGGTENAAGGLEARLPRAPLPSVAASSRGPDLPFRPLREGPESIAPAARSQEGVEARERPIEEGNYSFLGRVQTVDGKSGYFFKNVSSGRVVSTGLTPGVARLLSESEKEFVIEIDGRRYRVDR